MAGLILSLSSYPSPQPGLGIPAGAEARAEELLSLRNRLQGSRPNDGAGDPEDFWEQAARLSAAWESSAEELWLLTGQEKETLLRGERASDLPLVERANLPKHDPGHLALYGPLNMVSPYWRVAEGTGADYYGSWDVFTRHAGRPLALVGVHMETAEGSLPHVMAQWVQEGTVAEGESVILKTIRAKHGLWRIRASSDVARNQATVRDALGWTAVHFEGTPKAFLLQGMIPMEHEYRIFFVNGIPLTGAGCIEEFTPLFNRGDDFDLRTRRERGVTFAEAEDEEPEPGLKSSVAENPDLVARYVALAHAIGGELPVGTAAVDFAWNPAAGEVVVIEANSLGNSGLYASKPELVAQAIVANLP